MRYGRVCFFVFKGAMFLRDHGVCGCTLPTLLGFRNELVHMRKKGILFNQTPGRVLKENSKTGLIVSCCHACMGGGSMHIQIVFA